MRAKQRRRERTRRVILVSLAALVLGLIAGGVYLYTNSANSSFDGYIGKTVSSSDYSALVRLAQKPYDSSDPALASNIKAYGGPPFSQGGKPVVVYIGAEFCPYCATLRWSFIISLLRFGNFTNLSYMASSATEAIGPDTATFSFRGSSYSSKYLVFEAYELQDRSGNPYPGTLPSNYSTVFQQFGSAYPIVDFGNRYVLPGSILNLGSFKGLNWTRVIADITTGTRLGVQVKQLANLITATVCQVTNNQPAKVCADPAIAGISSNLPPVIQVSSSTSFTMGIPISTATTWASVQYEQMAWRTPNSMKSR